MGNYRSGIVAQGKSIVNSILKEGEENFIRQAN
jgi:hypothetical protein